MPEEEGKRMLAAVIGRGAEGDKLADDLYERLGYENLLLVGNHRGQEQCEVSWSAQSPAEVISMIVAAIGGLVSKLEPRAAKACGNAIRDYTQEIVDARLDSESSKAFARGEQRRREKEPN